MEAPTSGELRVKRYETILLLKIPVAQLVMRAGNPQSNPPG